MEDAQKETEDKEVDAKSAAESAAKAAAAEAAGTYMWPMHGVLYVFAIWILMSRFPFESKKESHDANREAPNALPNDANGEAAVNVAVTRRKLWYRKPRFQV